MLRRMVMGVAVGVAGFGATAPAAIVVNDTFDAVGATRRDDAGDPNDLAFFTFSDGAGLAVQSVDGGGGYLKVTAPGNARFGTAAFSPVTLANVGDRLSLKFRVQVYGPNGQDRPEFRMGIYSSGGTAATDDSAASRDAAADDKGYKLNQFDDPDNFYSGTFGNDLVGTTLSDYESGGFTGSVRLSDGAWHTYEIALERNSFGVTTIMAFDGVEKSNSPFGGDPSLLTFDNIQFGGEFGGGARPVEIRLDDVVVEYTPVPEPAGVLVAGALGAVAYAGWRRQA